jgi:hypothetical protein
MPAQWDLREAGPWDAFDGCQSSRALCVSPPFFVVSHGLPRSPEQITEQEPGMMEKSFT